LAPGASPRRTTLDDEGPEENTEQVLEEEREQAVQAAAFLARAARFRSLGVLKERSSREPSGNNDIDLQESTVHWTGIRARGELFEKLLKTP
jgi:hypothetical protein